MTAGVLPAALAESSGDELTLLKPVFKKTPALTEKQVPLVIAGSEDSEIPLFFAEEAPDLPFVTVETAADLLRKDNLRRGFDDYTLTVERTGNTWFLTREDGSFVMMDFREKEWLFSDYNRFVAPTNAVNAWTSSGPQAKAADTQPYLIKHMERLHREGEMVDLNTGHYAVPAFVTGGTGYVPVQIVSDILISPLGDGLFFNGECLFLAASSELGDELADRYNAPGERKKSEALRQYTYNELCLALDFTYGLMKEHEIESFDELFIQTGIAGKLFTDSAADTYAGIKELTDHIFNDGHSASILTPWTIDEYDPEEMDADGMLAVYDPLMQMFLYDSKRRSYYPDGPVGYEEVGDTAYLTFDVFAVDDKIDYYSVEPANTTEDTITLLMYANEQLHRDNCPIRNVVIDLTNNGGGAADSAMCVIAWFLGVANFSLEDTHNLYSTHSANTLMGNR